MFGNARAQNLTASQPDGVALNGTFPSIAEPPSPPPISITPPPATSVASVADGNKGQEGQDTTAQSQAPGIQTPTPTQVSNTAQVQPAVQPITQPVAEPATQPVVQPEPSLEFKKGPFDEPESTESTAGKTATDGVAAQDSAPDKPTANMSDDEKTKALRKSLGLDDGEKQSPVAKPADEATFPSVAQLDQAGGAGMSPVPVVNTNTANSNVNKLEKLMDEIVWDLAGVQAKIRQLKDKMEEGSEDFTPSATSEKVPLDFASVDKKDSENADKTNTETKENPLAGYKI